jgi:hypothetical protein
MDLALAGSRSRTLRQEISARSAVRCGGLRLGAFCPSQKEPRQSNAVTNSSARQRHAKCRGPAFQRRSPGNGPVFDPAKCAYVPVNWHTRRAAV